MGDGGPTDINNDGNTSNDLFYVPTGIDDPIINWRATGGQDALAVATEFMSLIDSSDGLSQYKGQVVPRNSGTAPWIHQFDINITHEIGFFNGHTLELIFAIENLGNLINSEWGLERRIRGSGGNLAIMDVKNTTGFVDGVRIPQYDYFANPDLLSEDEWYQSRTFSSRWAMQLGVRYKF
jgi:hypothetical protein